MMIHSDISFRKTKLDDGFGFSCMKAAYAFGITGKMIYGQESGVMIEAEGDQEKMDDFIRWIEIQLKEQEEKISCSTGCYSGKFNEFDIFRKECMPSK